MKNRIFGKQNGPENPVPPFDGYQKFVLGKRQSGPDLRQKFFFLLGLFAFWVVLSVGFAYALMILLQSIAFIPKSFSISVLDILKIQLIFTIIWAIKKAFPLM